MGPFPVSVLGGSRMRLLTRASPGALSVRLAAPVLRSLGRCWSVLKAKAEKPGRAEGCGERRNTQGLLRTRLRSSTPHHLCLVLQNKPQG